MAEIQVPEVVAKILKEEGVEWYTGVHGASVWPLMTAIDKAGIKMYHMRHEQSGVYMADGWARTTGRPGVAMGSAGPGFGNMVSAMYQAYHAKSPVICLLGQHSPSADGWSAWQETYAEPLSGHFTKWIKRLVDPSMTAYLMQKAFRDATTYPCGPVAIEFPGEIQRQVAGDEDSLRGYLPHGVCASPSQPAGNPQMVEKAVRMLLEAKKPVVIGGDGIYWSNASEELK